MRYSWIALLCMYGCPKFEVPQIPNSATCVPSADFKSMECTIGTAVQPQTDNSTATTTSVPSEVDGVADENDGTTDEVAPAPPMQVAIPTLADFLKCMQIEDEKFFGSIFVGDAHTRFIEVKNTCAYHGYLHVVGVMHEEDTDDGTLKLIDEGQNSDYHFVESDVWVAAGKSSFVEVEFRPTLGNGAYGIGEKVERFSVLAFDNFSVWIDGVETLIDSHNVFIFMNLWGWVNEPVAPVAVIKGYLLTDEANGYYEQIENGTTLTVGSSIKLDGQQSFGAGVGKLVYEWAMNGPDAPPEGSMSHLKPGSFSVQSVTFDQVGDYSFILSVGENLMENLPPHWSKIPAVFTVHIVEPSVQ